MKSFLVTLICTLNSLSSNAHTSYPTMVECPVCKDSVKFHVTMSRTTFGSYYDFQDKGAIGDYYEQLINGCDVCYYSGYRGDFDTTFAESYIDSIKTVTSKYMDQKLDDALEHVIAAEIKMLRPYDNDHIANIYLIGSYFLRNAKKEKQEERRKELQLETIRFLKKAIDEDEYEKDVVATIHYLVAEMHRRRGEFDEAIEYYDLAINDKNKQDWVEEVAKEQKKLAEEKNDDNSI